MVATKKKATARKTTGRKTTSRKPAARKPAARTPAARKPAARKPAAEKTAAKAAPRKKAPRATEVLRARGSVPRRPRPGAEQPNLEELTRLLRDRVTSRVPSDYSRGKTRLRDEVMSLLACSPARAEHIVDSMVARGYARFGSHPRFTTDPRFGIWHLDDSP